MRLSRPGLARYSASMTPALYRQERGGTKKESYLDPVNPVSVRESHSSARHLRLTPLFDPVNLAQCDR